MKKWYQSKTIWVNIISGLVMFLSGTQVISVMSPAAVPYVSAAVFGLNIILRTITTASIGNNQEGDK